MTRYFLFFGFLFFTVSAFAQVHVRGYYRSNGTYVQPHERTRPNHTVTDNYSYPGNYNPNTGKITSGSSGSSSSEVQTPSTYGNYTANPKTYSEPTYTTKDNTTIQPISTGSTSTQLYAETEINASLKKEPSYMSNSTYAIPGGANVKISKYNENYYLAEVDGRSGYVCTCQIKKTFTKP